MVTKILDHLYLGGLTDALTFKGEIICVTQEVPRAEPEDAYCIPIIRSKVILHDNELLADQDDNIIAMKHQIDLVTFMIEKNLKYKSDTLVHCMAGIERSPLVIASYLHDNANMTWDEAYDFIKEKRPEVANRLQWLNLSYDERQS